MAAPVTVKAIPDQIMYEQASITPIILKEFFEGGEAIEFSAALEGGAALPVGLSCSAEGEFSGTPAKDTRGKYRIVIQAKNADGMGKITFTLTIKESLALDNSDYLTSLKAQVWQALEQKLPVPDLVALNSKQVTRQEVFYLLERFATMTIFNSLDWQAPGDKTILKLEGASEYFYAFDRGSCLVMTPKDLFSHERTLNDAMQTAKAMAREVYERQWMIEMTGYPLLKRAAWVELQHLQDQFGRKAEIVGYDATFQDLRVYNEQSRQYGNKRMENP